MTKIQNFFITIILLIILTIIAPKARYVIQQEWNHHFLTTNQIGYIEIDGIINHVSTYRSDIVHFFKNPAIKAILIKIESSGGSTGSCQALAFDIEYLKKEYPKPIIAYVENLCTGGAYQIAASTDHIVATGSAIIGNIGIDTNLLPTLGENIYQQMSKEIAFKRHLQLSKIDSWGQNKTFTGQQAYDLKLIDSLGSITTATNLIKKNIIPSDKTIEWITASQESRNYLWNTNIKNK